METALDRYVVSGGIMMIFLVPLALLTIGFIVQGFINLRRARVAPASFTSRLPELISKCATPADAEAALQREGHSLALVLSRAIRHLNMQPDADPADIIDESIEAECTVLQQRNSQLSLVYNVAPLMGLLGTVFGLLQTFAEFTQAADPSVKDLGQGVNVALITTAWGLSIAIPAFIFMYFFTMRINKYEQVILPREAQSSLETVLATPGLVPRTAEKR